MQAMSKRRATGRNFIYILLFIIAVGCVIGGAIYTAHQLSAKKVVDQPCSPGRHANHAVVIRQAVVTPSHTTAHRCDSLTITNRDDTNRLMAFGVHEHHTPYDGLEEKLLGKNQSLRITLDKTGDFRFHDHLHDEVEGTFTVTR
jgi:hypothetical protein